MDGTMVWDMLKMIHAFSLGKIEANQYFVEFFQLNGMPNTSTSIMYPHRTASQHGQS